MINTYVYPFLRYVLCTKSTIFKDLQFRKHCSKNLVVVQDVVVVVDVADVIDVVVNYILMLDARYIEVKVGHYLLFMFSPPKVR